MATATEVHIAGMNLLYQTKALSINTDVLPTKLNRQYKEFLVRYLDARGSEREEISVLIQELLDPDAHIRVDTIALEDWCDGEPEVERLEARKRRFGERLTKLMKERGIKKKDLAKQLDVTPPCISQFASGKHKPQSETLRRLAEALKCKVGDLWPD